MTAICMGRPAPSTLVRALAAPGFVYASLTLGMLLRVAAVFGIDVEQTSDFAWYLDRAREIATGQGYVLNGIPTAYWPVGYPGFLGALFMLFGSDPVVGQVANLALSLGILLAVRAVALRMGIGPAAANLAVMLMAVYPNHVAYSPLLSAELLCSFLTLLGLVLVLRGGTAACLAAGMVFGCAVLTKPQILPLPLAFVLLAHLRRPMPWGKLIAAAALVHVALAVTLLPWQIRNQEIYGQFTFVSANGGGNLLIGANPAATGGWMKPAITYQGAAAEITAPGELARDKQAAAMAVAWIKANPLAFLAGMPAKLGAQLASDGEAEWAYQDGMRSLSPDDRRLLRGLRWVNQVYYGLLLAGALVGLGLLVRDGIGRRPPIIWAGLAVMLYVAALGMLFFGAPRFHFPMMPFVAIYAGLALAWPSARRTG